MKGWIRFCYSKNPLHVLRFSLPVILICFVLGWKAIEAHFLAILWVPLGVVLWTLFEYFMHKYPFHWTPKHPVIREWVHKIHYRHHLYPNDYELLNGGPFFVMPQMVFHFLFWIGVTQSVSVAGLLFCGNVIGYTWYEFMHYAAHAGAAKTGWLGYMRKYHQMHHHGDWGRQFGVTTPFWDYVFGTAPRKNSK